MADRIIFRLKHDGETLAYLYQRWGAQDGEELEHLTKKAAKEYNLDLTKREDAIQAVRIAGEGLYGHAIWNNAGDSTDPDYVNSLKRDKEYLEAHRDDIIADNQDTSGFDFFYGTFEDYPAYIDGWCECDYTMQA